MRSIAKNKSAGRRLAVKWLEQPGARAIVVGMRKARRTVFLEARKFGGLRGRTALPGDRRAGRLRAFTLLELLVVMAIIGFIAAMTLPHVGGFNRANGLTSATQQLLNDVARARSRAMANRSNVYMVFVPNFSSSFNSLRLESQTTTTELTNLLGHQSISYALVTDRTVGDQPGQHFARYLTEWQTLPSGIFFVQHVQNILPVQAIAPLTIYTTNTFTGTINSNGVYALPTNSFPFPSINAGTSMNMPYIEFTPQGTLSLPYNEYIWLARGSLFFAQDVNGNYLGGDPDVVETPPGNHASNPCLIKIDWLTARASIVQNQFQ